MRGWAISNKLLSNDGYVLTNYEVTVGPNYSEN